jgi:hypothetical protein
MVAAPTVVPNAVSDATALAAAASGAAFVTVAAPTVLGWIESTSFCTP